MVDDDEILKKALKVLLFLSSVEKATIGRIIDETDFDRGDVMQILDVGKYVDIIIETDGFYRIDDRISFTDFQYFIKYLTFESRYAKQPRKKEKYNFTVATSKAQINTKKDSKNRLRSTDNKGIFPTGGSNGMPHFEWNDRIALEFYNEMEALRRARRKKRS